MAAAWQYYEPCPLKIDGTIRGLKGKLGKKPVVNLYPLLPPPLAGHKSQSETRLGPMEYGGVEVIALMHIELDRLLSCPVDELIALVQPMSCEACELHARAILDWIGGPSFEQLMMRIVETALPNNGGRPPTNSDTYYLAVRELFPHIGQENDAVGRLVFLVIHMATLRLEENPTLRTH
jgi:hypothetical protein